MDIVFDGFPGPESPRFVEIEIGGRNARVGKWLKREDGLVVLRLTADQLDTLANLTRAATNLGKIVKEEGT